MVLFLSMKKIKVVLIGRPNVGKSALFNRIANKPLAIVDAMEGVTRDRLYADAQLFGHPFQVIDTGGIDERSGIPFAGEVRAQAEHAIREADSLILVVDSRVGVTALDEEICRLLLKSGKPLVLAVNKVDGEDETAASPFYSLGIQKIFPVSAIQGWQIVELLEGALSPFSLEEEVEEKHRGIQVAIVGRPNVGKSTLVNALLNEKRCVVSPIAGTTRDTIDVAIDWDGVPLTLIDTAGIRRKHAERTCVDKFAAIRTERAIERCDVCAFLLDAEEGITMQEKKILSRIEAKGKGCVLFFNKWDLVKGFRMEHCQKTVQEEGSFLSDCPVLFGSAKTGRNLDALFPKIQEVHRRLHTRISTGKLNQFIEKALQGVHPPMVRGKRLRIYYMAQIDIAPPRFVLFVNDPSLLGESYKKYLLNQFRKVYGFLGAPLIFYLKGKKKQEGKKTHWQEFLKEPLSFEGEKVGSHLNSFLSIKTVG